MSQRLNLNINPGQAPQTFHLTQGDIGRTLVAELADGSGVYTIPSGATVTIEGTKPSGLGFKKTGTVSAGAGGVSCIVSFTSTAEMTDEIARIPAKIKIRNANTLVIGTATVYLDIDRNPHPDDTTDGCVPDVINAITALVERVEAAVAKAEVLHEAEAWAVGKRDDIPVGEDDDTYHNNSKWYSDQANISKTAASASEQVASEKASQAAASAADAATAKTNAETAKTAAEAAAAAAASVFDVVGNVSFTVDPDDGHVTIWFTEEEET